MNPQRPFLFLLPILLLLASSAQASTYCVGTAQELIDVLNVTSQNNTDDEIRIKMGTYTSNFTFSYASNPNFTKSLSMSGGWVEFVDPCGFQIPFADATVIDGNDAGNGLQFSLQSAVSGFLSVSNLTVRNTYSTLYDTGLGVTILSDNAPQVRISNVAILNGESTTHDSGLFVYGRADVLVRNVLVANNHGAGYSGINILSNDTGPIVLNHITVANNVARNNYSGLYMDTIASSTVSNAIMSGNSNTTPQLNCDFRSFNQNTTVFNAVINKLCNALSPPSSGILNVDPLFVGAADYHLKGTSPAINAGVQNPIGGLTSFDLDGHDRSIGPKPDLGAYEAQDSLFKNGFDG